MEVVWSLGGYHGPTDRSFPEGQSVYPRYRSEKVLVHPEQDPGLVRPKEGRVKTKTQDSKGICMFNQTEEESLVETVSSPLSLTNKIKYFGK